jgi:hypothetical protein
VSCELISSTGYGRNRRLASSISATGYELLERAAGNQQNTACRCDADAEHAPGLVLVDHQVMRAIGASADHAQHHKVQSPGSRTVTGQHYRRTLWQSNPCGPPGLAARCRSGSKCRRAVAAMAAGALDGRGHAVRSCEASPKVEAGTISLSSPSVNQLPFASAIPGRVGIVPRTGAEQLVVVAIHIHDPKIRILARIVCFGVYDVQTVG